MSLPLALDAIRRDIERCYFAVCFDMESGQPLGISTAEFADDADSIASSFRKVIGMVRHGQRAGRNRTIREALNGFHSLILETDRSTFFVLVPATNEGVAIAVGTPKDVHLEFARRAIDKHVEVVNRAIQWLR